VASLSVSDHHAARSRHEERLARALSAFAARRGRSAAHGHADCPLARLANWIVAHRRPTAAAV